MTDERGKELLARLDEAETRLRALAATPLPGGVPQIITGRRRVVTRHR